MPENFCLPLEIRAIDAEARTITASISSEYPGQRWFGEEVLSHRADAVRLTRAKEGLPVLFGHDQRAIIGRTDRLELVGGRLETTIRFSRSALAEEKWQDVQDKVLRDVSVGYVVHDWAKTETGRRAIDWEPFEVSIVTVPVDPTVGLLRGGDIMPEPTPTPETIDRAALMTRNATLGELFKPFGGAHQELLIRALGDPSMTIETVQGELLRALSSSSAQPTGGRSSIQAGEDQIEKLERGIGEALELRAGLVPEMPKEGDNERTRAHRAEGQRAYRELERRGRENPFTGMTLLELGSEYLEASGIRVRGLSKMKRAGLMLQTRALVGHGISDFPQIFANVANKALQVGYDEVPETWRQWVSVGSLPDFKPGLRPVLSNFEGLDELPRGGGGYKYGSFGEHHASIQLRTFGKLFSINREAIINDDQRAFSMVPRLMGRAASRKVGDVVYNEIVIGNPAMTDGDTLFHANHANTAAAGAPSVAKFDAVYPIVAKQTDPKGITLNLQPRYILVPAALRPSSRALLAADKDPAVASGEAVNIYQNDLELVSEARLDADSASVWYLTCSPMQIETVEVAFLDGNQVPFLDEEESFEGDGLTWKVRHDFDAKPLDWRGMYKIG